LQIWEGRNYGKKTAERALNFLLSERASVKYRNKPTAFTRNRKLTFKRMIFLLMKSMKQSLQFGLYEFFKDQIPDSEIPTKSAFSQRRRDLHHGVFIEANDILVQDIYNNEDLQYWMDFRLLGIDGSKVNLPDSPEIMAKFDTQKNPYGAHAMAMMSCCYDVLNNIAVAATISSCKENEYIQACNLMHTIGDSHDLLIFDRGYGAFWFMHFIIRHKKDFVIRLNSVVIPEAKDWPVGSTHYDYQVINRNALAKFKAKNEPFTPFKLRYVTIILPNGERELLATSLLDEEKYPDEVFKELYALRWGIETYYHHLKIHMELENFSGKTVESIQQDFFAGIFMENIRVALEFEVNAQLKKKQKEQDYKYQYQVNRNISFGILRDQFVDICLAETSREKMFERVRTLFKLAKIPIKNYRHVERPSSRLGVRRHFFMSNRRAM
jgi:hypothetical protein